MATSAQPITGITSNVRFIVDGLTDPVNGSFYIVFYEGNAYSDGDTTPDDLPVTDAALSTDIPNPVFLKKINKAGADTFVKYVVPDDDNGTITAYGQRYREVPEADIHTEQVTHLYIEARIPANDILVSGRIRGLALLVNARKTDGTLATGDKYYASEIDFVPFEQFNSLYFIENRTPYDRVSTESGEFVSVVYALRQ